jgi:hypothetical protein
MCEVIKEGKKIFRFAFGRRKRSGNVRVNELALLGGFRIDRMKRFLVMLGADASKTVSRIERRLDRVELREFERGRMIKPEMPKVFRIA